MALDIEGLYEVMKLLSPRQELMRDKVFYRWFVKFFPENIYFAQDYVKHKPAHGVLGRYLKDVTNINMAETMNFLEYYAHFEEALSEIHFWAQQGEEYTRLRHHDKIYEIKRFSSQEDTKPDSKDDLKVTIKHIGKSTQFFCSWKIPKGSPKERYQKKDTYKSHPLDEDIQLSRFLGKLYADDHKGASDVLSQPGGLEAVMNAAKRLLLKEDNNDD